MIFMFLATFNFAMAMTKPSFEYNIDIDAKGYGLKMQLVFSPKVSLELVKKNFKDGDLLTRVGTNIKKITVEGISSLEYRSIMTVSSLGITSKLLSNCTEKASASTWTRHCKLDTENMDGGKFTSYKSDEISCFAKPNVECFIFIKGKLKPLKLFGLTILSYEKFTVRAKYQALNNYVRIWNFTESGNLDLKDSIHNDLEKFLDDGSKEMSEHKNFHQSVKWVKNE
ncbi:MAG: hypothetical protein A4S09_13805 [Proteobacteria bacterium SG_bin7]|nr:MAG: hypothetical protein A4S09_13805 [Proteobacteria bacterium SG_bin7]